MKPFSDTKPDAPSTKPSHRLFGGSLLGWIAIQLRSAFRILTSSRSSRVPDGEISTSTDENAFPSEPSASIDSSTREKATPNPHLGGQSNAENESIDTLHLMLTAEAASSQKHALPSSVSDSQLANPALSLSRDAFKPIVDAPPIFQKRQPDSNSFTHAHQSEVPARAQMLRPTTSQQGPNAVTRDELRRELDTLRRLIESRK